MQNDSLHHNGASTVTPPFAHSSRDLPSPLPPQILTGSSIITFLNNHPLRCLQSHDRMESCGGRCGESHCEHSWFSFLHSPFLGRWVLPVTSACALLCAKRLARARTCPPVASVVVLLPLPAWFLCKKLWSQIIFTPSPSFFFCFFYMPFLPLFCHHGFHPTWQWPCRAPSSSC